jgi:hypothetical protein
MPITTKGVDYPPLSNPLLDDNGGLTLPWWKWFSGIYGSSPSVNTYQPLLTPVSVPANSTAEQIFVVSGISKYDILIVNKPSATAGLAIINARAAGDNSVAIAFHNMTGAPITPPSETYRIGAIRL